LTTFVFDSHFYRGAPDSNNGSKTQQVKLITTWGNNQMHHYVKNAVQKNDCPVTTRGEIGKELLDPGKPADESMKSSNAARLFIMVVLLCSQMSVSCTEVDSVPSDSESISGDTDSAHETDETVLQEQLTTSIKGTRVFIVDPDNPDNNFITLDMSDDIIVSFENGLLEGTVSPGDDENTVKITVSFAKDVEPDFHIDTMHIGFSHTPDLTVSALVIARPSTMLVGAPEDMPTYLNNIGLTMDITADFLSHTSLAALNTHALYSADLIQVNTNAATTGIEINSQKYSEVVKQVTEQLSIKGNIPGSGKADGFLFSGSFNQSFTKDSKTTSKLEFTVEVLQKKMADANLPSDFRLDNGEFILRYITDEANQVLNVPTDPKYKKFSNEQAGIFALYKQYGTHVMTSGVFGGTYIYAYARKQNSYFSSTANYAGVSLSAHHAEHATGGNWMQSYLDYMTAVGASISAEGSNYNSDYSETYGEMTAFVVTGGSGSTDFGAWDDSLTDMNSNLALVQYTADSNDETGGLIPLYYLATGDRRTAMETNLEAYIESKKLPDPETPKLVVADFKMVATSTNGHDSAEKPEQKVWKDASGTDRLYYPLMANKYALVDKGKMLDTSQDDYIVVADGTDQLWWYALAFSDELADGTGGIKEIRFYNDDDDADFTTRGNRADHNMNYPEIDDHYVALSWTNDPDEMVTGVGLLMNDSGEYHVIASSAGTEMLLPFENATIQKQFTDHWGTFPIKEANIKSNDFWTLGSDNGSDKSDSWFGETAASNSSDHKIFPVYVKSDLGTNFKVQQPNKW
jgi:hypothetical protein